MKKYRCTVCEWVYDPAVGDPTGGIRPGTQFEEIPEDWVCPVAASAKTCSKRLRNNPVPPRRNGKAHPAGCALPFVTAGARTQAVSSE